MLPQDPVMLLSYINTQLRDNYSSLEDLAGGLDLSGEEMDSLVKKLGDIGYSYNAGLNQFK
jgi:biotin operon repressor